MVEIVIYAVAVFFAGSVLLLERRCLGQMAVVQPLVVCLLAGWLTGNIMVAIWLGVSLQLLSVSPQRRIDWALAGVVAAVTLFLGDSFGIPLKTGSPSALALLLVALLMGGMARLLEKRYARIDGEIIRTASPLSEDNPVRAIESHVHGRPVGEELDAEERLRQSRVLFEAAPRSLYPSVVEHAEHLASHGTDDEFVRGLRRILAGLKAEARNARSKSRRGSS